MNHLTIQASSLKPYTPDFSTPKNLPKRSFLPFGLNPYIYTTCHPLPLFWFQIQFPLEELVLPVVSWNRIYLFYYIASTTCFSCPIQITNQHHCIQTVFYIGSAGKLDITSLFEKSITSLTDLYLEVPMHIRNIFLEYIHSSIIPPFSILLTYPLPCQPDSSTINACCTGAYYDFVATYDSTKLPSVTKWIDCTPYSQFYYFIQNQGISPIEISLQISPDHNLIIDDIDLLRLQPKETSYISPLRTARYMRIQYKNIELHDKQPLYVWFQGHLG